jgi:hypothetical protein
MIDMTDILSRLDALEATRCRCAECASAARQRHEHEATLAHLEIANSPDVIARLRAMSPADRQTFFARVADERAIEILTDDALSEEEISSWAPIRVRDRVELRLADIPDRVRLSIGTKGFSYVPQRYFLDVKKDAKKLQALRTAGLMTIARDGEVIEFVTVRVSADYSPIITRQGLGAMVKVDLPLAGMINDGHVISTPLTDQQNRDFEAARWRTIDISARPPRRKRPVAPFQFDSGPGFDVGAFATGSK